MREKCHVHSGNQRGRSQNRTGFYTGSDGYGLFTRRRLQSSGQLAFARTTYEYFGKWVYATTFGEHDCQCSTGQIERSGRSFGTTSSLGGVNVGIGGASQNNTGGLNLGLGGNAASQNSSGINAGLGTTAASRNTGGLNVGLGRDAATSNTGGINADIGGRGAGSNNSDGLGIGVGGRDGLGVSASSQGVGASLGGAQIGTP